MTIDNTAADWLETQFETEYCDACGGAACHHTAVPFVGNWFARCNYPPLADGRLHPIIAAYRDE